MITLASLHAITRQAKVRIAMITLAAAAMAVPLAAWSDTSLWSVTRAGEKVLIGGTVHMLSDSDFPLPEEFDAAYAEADLLVFETDISALQSRATQVKLAQALVYPEGTTLADKVSADTLELFTAFLRERQLPVKQFLGFKPGMITVALTGLEMQRLGIDSAGVDQFYDDRARDDGTPRTGLESVDEQIGYIAAIGEANPDAIVRGLLEEVEGIGSLMDTAVSAWRAGDLQAIDAEIVEPMRSNYPVMYESLIRTRNANWLPRIMKLFDDEPTELVLVGAAHLAGPDGLLDALRNKGYTVTRY